MFVSICLITFWLVYPYEPFTAKQPFKVITKQLHIGEDFSYIAEYCKYTDAAPIKVLRQLIDGYAYDLPSSTSNNFPAGCRTVTVTLPLNVPATVHPGTYHVLITGSYQVNPVRIWTYQLKTEEFEIIK